MCGIAGIFNAKSDKSSELSLMLNELINRGPDSEGRWSDKFFQAGMRRLSINDLEGGNQPLFSLSKDIVLFYNGEIYNYPQLKQELIKDGITFRTKSDGEVICHLFKKYGKKSFSMLDGMFAISLWDTIEKKLFLVRDYPGEKPLYFSRLSNGTLIYGSSIKSILKSGLVSREIDYQAIWDYTSFLWIPEPRTIYKNIHSLMPGQILEIDLKSEIKFHEFKNEMLRPNLNFTSEKEATLLTRTIVTESIESRLLSDVPIGAFLSGGLDSSIVCAVAQRKLGNLSTYCIGFENLSDPYHGTADESSYAESFAKQLQTKHRTIRVTSKDFENLLETLIESAGQPFAVSSGLGILSIAKEAQKNNIKVLLSGDGADEAFGGYSWYPHLFSPAKGHDSFITKRFTDISGSIANKIHYMSRLKPQEQALAWHYYTLEEEKKLLFHQDIVCENSGRFFLNEKLETPVDFIANDRKFYFTNEMLNKVDRMTMAYSVEGRAPFAAPSVQFLADNLPIEYMISGTTLKSILRKAFNDILPDDITKRAKHGFNVPIDHWLKREWKHLFEDTFGVDSVLLKNQILSEDSYAIASKLLNDPGKITGHVILTFIILNLWWKKNVN